MLIDVQFSKSERVIEGVVDILITDKIFKIFRAETDTTIEVPIKQVLKVTIINLNGEDRVIYERWKYMFNILKNWQEEKQS